MIEARARAFFQLARASAYAENRLQNGNHVAHGHADKRSEVPRTVALDPPRNFDSRIFRARIYADIRACLVVFEQYVVVRLVLLDEVIFKRERILFGARY